MEPTQFKTTTIKNISYEEDLSFFRVGCLHDGFSASV